jgi:GNAT superfamily N-acetyltransferase
MGRDVRIVDLVERPDLAEAAMRLEGIGGSGGTFTYQGAGYGMVSVDRYRRHWPRFFLVALEDDTPVARALGVPVAFPVAGREELPDRGWDQAIQWAAEDVLDGREPTVLCGVEVVIAPDRRGTGLAPVLVAALKAATAKAGLRTVYAPVRPFGKEAEPDTPMAEYVTRREPDGQLADRWMRTHERLGARLIRVCPSSLTVTGSLAEWHAWTGVQLADGENLIPGVIAPVVASTRHDYGVYVEPNVWFEHPL